MNPNREEALFALALEKSANKRPAFLDAKCAVRCRRSLVEAHFFQQRLETRLGAQGVETRIDFETRTKSILLLITSLQPIQALVLFAESKMEKRPQRRRDIALLH